MVHHEDGAGSGIDYAAQARELEAERAARIQAVESAITALFDTDLTEAEAGRLSRALQRKVFNNDDYDGIA